MTASIAQRALALFDTLVELPPAEQQARLSALREEDAALAARVAELLRADAEASGVLDRGVQPIVAGVVAPAPTQATGAASRVGAFTLLRPLGQGGMGEVWLAERREGAFVQQVALKLLKRGMDSDALIARFVQERRILAELNHPGIARFIDGGVSDDGRLYFAMEYVAGESLNEYARQRTLSVRERVRLIAEVCDAVAYAQSHLVVHRDLKPSNVLVDAEGRTHVLDFGIAKLLGDSAPDDTMTQTGARALSPAYAAPEQILGERISTATDVYALGVLLYEMLTGVLPHARAQHSLEGLIAAVQDERAAAPSQTLRRGTTTTHGAGTQRALREIAGDLDTVVLTALRREPARRYASAAAFAEDLRRWLDARPVAAQPDTRGYRLRKFVARNRLAVGSASAVFLTLLAGLAMTLWQAKVAREQARVAEAERARAEAALKASTEAGARTKRVKEFLMRTFIAVDPIQRPGAAAQTLSEAFDEALKRIDTEVAGDAKLQVDLLDDFGESLSNQGRFDEAETLFARALALAETQYPPDDPVIAETLLNQVALANATGTSLRALAAAERAHAILQAHRDDLPSQYAQALSALAVVRSAQGSSNEALTLNLEVLAIARALGDPNSDQLLSALYNVSSGLLGLGRHAEAEPYAREALIEAKRLWGPDTPRLSTIMSVLQMIVYRMGNMDEATQLAQESYRLAKNAFGDQHPMTAEALGELASIEEERGQIDAAREHYDAAIGTMLAIGDEQVIMALRSRALFRRRQGDSDGALADFDEALAQCRRHRPDHLICLVVRANRAGHLARMGRGDEALREADAVLTELKRTKQDGDNEYPQALEARAFALHALGRREEAVATQQQAIDRYVAIFGVDHAEAKRARGNLEKLRK
jgi:serine/threonine-protein kinase